MKKVCKYAIAAIVISFLSYHSIYFKNLEDIKQQRRKGTFNAAEYARDFWDNQLSTILGKAVDVRELIELFNVDRLYPAYHPPVTLKGISLKICER